MAETGKSIANGDFDPPASTGSFTPVGALVLGKSLDNYTQIIILVIA